MSHLESQEQSTIVPTAEVEPESQSGDNLQLPINLGQPQVNIVVNQHIGQQVIQMDNRQFLSKTCNRSPGCDIEFGDEDALPQTSSFQQSQELNTAPSIVHPQSSSQDTLQFAQIKAKFQQSKRGLISVMKKIFPGANKAIKKLKEATHDLYERKLDVDVSKFDVSPDNLPEIYSELFLVSFYEGRFIPDDDKYGPRTQQFEFIKSDQKVTIEQLLFQNQTQKFISIIGYPGAGKTTLSKRVARRLDQNENFIVLRIPFMNMSDGDATKATLKEFLLGNVNYNLEEEEKNSAFGWIKHHSKNCFIILDGFDQISWEIIQKDYMVSYDTLLTHQELVSYLCHGIFLCHCHILFTSRPHAMLKIPAQCQPKKTYYIGNLTSENMRKLFFVLVNNEQRAFDIWESLTVKTPHLESICHNPLMLQLYLRAALSTSSESADISTMTRIFHIILENLKASEHSISLSDEIVMKLSKIAYKATNNRTVLITIQDLQEEGLTCAQVQDLVVTLLGSNKTCGLLEGKKSLYFTHQTFQEYFSALYITHHIQLKSFTPYFSPGGDWSVVVQFLSGLLLDPYMNKDQSSSPINRLHSVRSTPTSSKSSFKEVSLFLPTASNNKQHNKEQFILDFGGRFMSISGDNMRLGKPSDAIIHYSKILRECCNIEMTKAPASSFAGGWIVMTQSHTPNDFHAVTCFIKSMPAQIKLLCLSSCNMTSEDFLPYAEAITSMPGSIDQLNISYNNLSMIHHVTTILHKVMREVKMHYSFFDADRRLRHPNKEERRKLQKALDELENKNLKIAVDWDDQDNCIYLTHKNRIS